MTSGEREYEEMTVTIEIPDDRADTYRKPAEEGDLDPEWLTTCSWNRMKNRTEDGIPTYTVVEKKEKGTGPGSAGQSGDTQGLPDVAEADSESVEELAEEGQYEEAELILEMEETPDGEVKEVRTRQVPQDDVPLEYLDQD